MRFISIDYDGTITHDDYPRSGTIKKDAADAINKLYDQGYQILIWTCRSGEPLDIAKQYLAECGVKYHYINENHPALIEKYGCDCRKQSADVYIDDKAILGIPKDWIAIYRLIKKKVPL